MQRVRRPAQCRGGLLQVVLKKPGFGQGASNGEFILTIERPRAEQRNEMGRRVGTPPTLQGRIGPGKGRVKGWGRHRQEYTKYTSRWKL